MDGDGRELLPLTIPPDEGDLIRVNVIAVCLLGYGSDELRAAIDCAALSE